MKSIKKKLLWSIVFLALVILTIYVITNQSKTFTIKGFADFIAGANPCWIVLAFLGMIGFIYFEALAIRTLSGMFGYKKSLKKNFVYSSSDIYFSAITPSATGGQPAAAMFMISDGIPTPVTTIVLLLNVTLYAMTLIVLGIVCFLFSRGTLGHFDSLSVILIIIGFLAQIVLVAVFLLLVYKEKIIMKIAAWGIRLLSKMHLIKDTDGIWKRLERAEQKYKECAGAIVHNKRNIMKAFFYNILQRISQMLVTVCVYMAFYGDISKLWEVFMTQGYVVLGSNTIPIPGAVGVADYLFIDGFGAIVQDPVNIELLSRGISFYSSVIICGILTLAVYLTKGLKGIKQKKNEK